MPYPELEMDSLALIGLFVGLCLVLSGVVSAGKLPMGNPPRLPIVVYRMRNIASCPDRRGSDSLNMILVIVAVVERMLF